MRTLIALSLFAMLCACGVKGDLERPQPDPEEQRQPVGRY